MHMAKFELLELHDLNFESRQFTGKIFFEFYNFLKKSQELIAVLKFRSVCRSITQVHKIAMKKILTRQATHMTITTVGGPLINATLI